MNKKTAGKTGGGEPEDDLDDDEERMLGLIGRQVVLGIDGGMDSSKIVSDGLPASLEDDDSQESWRLASPSSDYGRGNSLSPIRETTGTDIFEVNSGDMLTPQSTQSSQGKRRRTEMSTSLSGPINKKLITDSGSSRKSSKSSRAGTENESLLDVQKEVSGTFSKLHKTLTAIQVESNLRGEKLYNVLERGVTAIEHIGQMLEQHKNISERLLKLKEENSMLKKLQRDGGPLIVISESQLAEDSQPLLPDTLDSQILM